MPTYYFVQVKTNPKSILFSFGLDFSWNLSMVLALFLSRFSHVFSFQRFVELRSRIGVGILGTPLAPRNTSHCQLSWWQGLSSIACWKGFIITCLKVAYFYLLGAWVPEKFPSTKVSLSQESGFEYTKAFNRVFPLQKKNCCLEHLVTVKLVKFLEKRDYGGKISKVIT